MQEPAPAKVNLFLHVGAKRRDGYHDLTSLVVFPDVGDVVSASAKKIIPGRQALPAPGGRVDKLRQQFFGAGENRKVPLPRIREDANSGPPTRGGQDVIELAVKGPFAKDLQEGPPSSLRDIPAAFGEGRFSNLVLRAAEALARGTIVPPTKITLAKNLPIASGIGGGSADAAATLRILNEVWGLRLAMNELRAIGLTLGSDVPVCVEPKTQWMEGRGERVDRGPRMPEVYLALVNPGIPVPTGEVFRRLTKKSGAERPPAPKSFASARSLAAWLTAETHNDLQAPAIQIAPPVADVLTQLGAQAGCLLARMSGSGATCFGLFDSAREAKGAAAAMPKDWWAKAGSCG